MAAVCAVADAVKVAAILAAASAAADAEAAAYRAGVVEALAQEVFTQGRREVICDLANRLSRVLDGEYQIECVHALIAVLAHLAAKTEEPYHAAGAYATLLGFAMPPAIASVNRGKS